MKRFFLLAAAMILGIMLSAQTQTQQGYVKTKGRMVNGKLVPGQGLKGATVSVHGRTTVLVNADNGAFSFPVPEAQFRLDSVRKKGYQLVDMDALGKIYKHSSNPLYLVMETPEQQLQDQLSAERKIRRILTDQLHQREDEIEALKEQQKITDEEYRLALQKLYEDTDQNEQLVKDMVERYSKIDYDQLDEFDKQISEYILNGELTKADSMLRTKGDINERVEQYRKHEAINAKEKGELSKRQEQLEQSEALAIQERDDLANDCYRKFEIFKMKHENDSAAYYIELRAKLDKTNKKWLNDAVHFIGFYTSNFEKTIIILKDDINLFIDKDDQERISVDYTNLGVFYSKQGKYDLALDYLEKGLQIKTEYLGENHLKTAKSYFHMGTLYYKIDKTNEAMGYYQKALSIYQSTTETNPIDIADCYLSIGNYYRRKRDFDKALEYMNDALQITIEALGENCPHVAACYNNIGLVFSKKGDCEKALEYYNKSIEIDTVLFTKDNSRVATVYNNIATCYRKTDKDKAIEYLILTLDIFQNSLGTYHPKVASTYTNIGVLYSDNKEYDKALECLNKGLIIRKNIFGDCHSDVANSYNNLAVAYEGLGDYSKALENLKKALEINAVNHKGEDGEIAINYKNIATVYYKLQEYDSTAKYYQKALDIYLLLPDDNRMSIALCHYNLGIVFSMKQDFSKSLEHYYQALALYESLIGTNDPKTKKVKEKISEIQAKLKEQEIQPNE